MSEMQPILRLNNVVKSFGNVVAVDQLSLDIDQGKIFTFLGPSGCGKTTTLRMLAGLEYPDEGEIYYKERTLVSTTKRVFVRPEARQMGMVFQSYAIWPNMTVFENIAYPLKLRRCPASILKEKVNNVMRVVGLEGFNDRPGPLLSGGQQQRVALARALVYEPDILLLDEPLSNLDAKLREQMRVELKLLQQKLGITVIFVTHDQLEALSLSDKIAVMHAGKIEQLGNPKDIYERPRTPFVRDFIGKTLILESKCHGTANQNISIQLSKAQSIALSVPVSDPNQYKIGDTLFIAVRPEDIIPSNKPGTACDNQFEGIVEACLFLGDKNECQVKVGEEHFLVYVPRQWSMVPGDRIWLGLPKEIIRVWEA